MSIKGFDWDKGNAGKNWSKHKVTDQECEEVFFDSRLLVPYDKGHSVKEARYSRRQYCFTVLCIRKYFCRAKALCCIHIKRRKSKGYLSKGYEQKGGERA